MNMDITNYFYKYNQVKHLFLMIFMSLFILACQADTTTSESALQIRSSINSNNVELFESLTDFPLTVNEQVWESATDGSGFVLGKRSDKTIVKGSSSALEIKPLLESINIQGMSAITDGITLSLFSEELTNQTQNWRNLDLVLFKRGEGDVEHVVLLGLNKKTKKLHSIYIN